MYPTLTKRQKEVLDYIKVFSEIQGYAPSLMDIKRHFNLSAISTVHEHIQNLKEKGYLYKEINQARSMRIVDPTLESNEIVEIPILGTVTSNHSILKSNKFQSTHLHRELLGEEGRYFGLINEADDLGEHQIFEDDLLLFVDNKMAEHGDIVTVQLSKTTTAIKRFQFEKGKPSFLDLSESSSTGVLKDASVVGALVTLIRRFGK
ncbi:MAG: LexA family protein [Candidatus Dojkabacteria bacterium]